MGAEGNSSKSPIGGDIKNLRLGWPPVNFLRQRVGLIAADTKSRVNILWN
jgi:hypothetical protein